ncbi:MAG: penicillin acylase family protein [Thermodesulfobacteriota bacterium]
MSTWLRIQLVFLFLVATVVPAWGKATINRDQHGIPSIQADTEEELFEAFGYVTAVDRLWQMEVNRRWGRGALAEIFGPKLVPADTQARLMGYTEEECQAMFAKLPPSSQKLIQAYLAGVNRRVTEVLADPKLMPMEYLALKFKPGQFTVSDIFYFFTALMRRFGMIGGGELKNLAALQTLTERFGPREGWAVFNDWCVINDYSAPTYIQEKIEGNYIPKMTLVSAAPTYLRPDSEVGVAVRNQEKIMAQAVAEAARVGAPIRLGSYSWTLSPQVTGTGYPILVGQPQMGWSVPGIVYEVQLKGGEFDVVGMAFPLIPIIPIGHNRYLAWSHMVGMTDNVDVYQEVLNPLDKEEYLFQGAWKKMTKRTEKIAVAGGQAKEITIYRTIHGPVFSPVPFDPKTAKEDRVYTKKLAHWLKEPLSEEGWLKAMRAKDAQEFGAAMSLIMTSLHTTYADTKGNIGYWHTGLNPQRVEGFDPRLPLPGTGEAEWTGQYLPSAHVINPPKGYVTGWNNKSSPDTRNPFDEREGLHSFGRFHRSLWPERALAGRKGLDLAANKEIMKFMGGAGALEHGEPWETSHNAPGGAIKDLLPLMTRAAAKAKEEDKPLLDQVLKVLAAWDGRAVTDAVKEDRLQAGQTILLDWLPEVLRAAFGDELDGFENLKFAHNRIMALFLRCLDGPTSPLPVSRNYFDNVKTQPVETVEDVFLQTLLATAHKLKSEFQSDDPAKWRAPRSKITFKHDLFGKVAEMWDNNIGTYVFIVEARPDGAVGYSRWPIGQSGNVTLGPDQKPVFDPHFLDMLPLYQGYEYQKMGLD